MTPHIIPPLQVIQQPLPLASPTLPTLHISTPSRDRNSFISTSRSLTPHTRNPHIIPAVPPTVHKTPETLICDYYLANQPPHTLPTPSPTPIATSKGVPSTTPMSISKGVRHRKLRQAPRHHDTPLLLMKKENFENLLAEYTTKQ